MSEESTITIWNESISVRTERMHIHDLKYLSGNPRVAYYLEEEDEVGDSDELQKSIEKIMLKQTSVKNLIPAIKKHGGLFEHILVRYDTKEVIEGNSRLAVFRDLYQKTKDERWATIPCNCVSKLTDEQQDTYLNQIHIAGKTPWDPYEKANFSYIRNKRGISVEKIAKISLVSQKEISNRIKTIELMKGNRDKEKSHYSYYDVLVTTKVLWNELKENEDFKNAIFGKIKNQGSKKMNDVDFNSQDLRKKVPIILQKKRLINKFIDGKLTLDEAYQNARPSNPQHKVRMAREKVNGISKAEVSRLEIQKVNALLADMNKLVRVVNRTQQMVATVKQEKEKQ